MDRKVHKRSRVYLIIAISVWIGAAILWVALNPVWATRQDESQTIAAPQTTQGSKSTSIKGIPATLEIPSIGVQTAVEQVGISAKGNVGIPKSYANVGWFTYGPKPGEPGASIIDGHVNDYFGKPAVFTRLKELMPGDDIYVTTDQGQRLHFQVVNSKSVGNKNFSRQEIFGPYPDARLNLITCTGTWIESQKMYDQRLVIFSKLVDTSPVTSAPTQ